MSLLHVFDSQEKRQMKSQVLDLIRMALADGAIDNTEMEYITGLARKFSITTHEIDAIINRPEDFIFTPPENRVEAFERMFNLVGAMIADGEIHENEMKLCRFYAISLGFNQEKIDVLIDEIIDSLQKEEEDEQVYKRIDKVLKSSE
jgi:uncharacterized tellurite resistance protein B-like protein